MFDPANALSALRSAIQALRAEDVGGATDERLEAGFTELQRAAQELEAERLRRLAEIHRRQSHQRDGHLSTAAWLVERHRMGWTTASREIRTARSLERMPHTRSALTTGDLTPSAVQMLVAARHAHPAQFHQSEQELVQAAKLLPAGQLQRTVSHWRQTLDWSQGLTDAERLRERRRLAVSPTLFGMVRVDGELDPETGETVLAAPRHCQDRDRGRSDPEDRRPSQHRRADALGEVCRWWLDWSDRPMMAGERPHVAVIVDLEALEGRAPGRSEFEHVGPIHPEFARRWACDASVSRIVTRGVSEPLDVGRKTSVVPAPMRRAIVVRDGHCRFPGCDRPHTWCDAHHVVHWADGGRTALSNLVLLCRRHHRLVHHRFRLEMLDGRPVFHKPDGTLLEESARASSVNRWPLPSEARSAGSTPPRIPSGAPA